MAILNIDKNRVLIKSASAEKITGEWQHVVAAIITACQAHLGSRFASLYIGGSVGTGTAQKTKSDIDSYAIVELSKGEIEEAEATWLKEERKKIHAMFPFLRGVEIHLASASELSEARKFQMKILSALVYGKDYDPQLASYKLDKETLGSVRVNVEKDITKARRELSSTNDSAKIQRAGAWIAKRLIRSSGMLVLWKGDVFTMDIEPLVEMFTSSYPDQAFNIHTLLTWTNNPPSDKEVILQLLDSFGQWLVDEDSHVFNI